MGYLYLYLSPMVSEGRVSLLFLHVFAVFLYSAENCSLMVETENLAIMSVISSNAERSVSVFALCCLSQVSKLVYSATFVTELKCVNHIEVSSRDMLLTLTSLETVNWLTVC